MRNQSLFSARAAIQVLLLWKATFVQRANGLDFFNKSIDISDPDLVYSPGQDWIVAHNTTSNLTVETTDKAGATISFNFNGTQVIVVGAYGVNAANASFVGANYTIDGGKPVTSTIDKPSTGQEDRTIMFTSPILPYKSHTLLVTVVDDVPFYDFLGVNITTSNTPPPSSSTTTKSSQTGTGTTSSSSQDSGKKHGISNGIIGGIVVAVVLLGVLVTLCVYMARWRRNQKRLFGSRSGQRSNQFSGASASYSSPPGTSFVVGAPSIVAPPEPVPPLPRIVEDQKLRPIPPEHHEREVHSPTSTLISDTSHQGAGVQGSGVTGGLAVMRQPSVQSQGHSSNNSQTQLQPNHEAPFPFSRTAARNPWPLPAEAPAMSSVEDEQSILPEMKPSGGILSRSKESLAMINLGVNRHLRSGPGPGPSTTSDYSPGPAPAPTPTPTPKKEKKEPYPDFFQW